MNKIKVILVLLAGAITVVWICYIIIDEKPEMINNIVAPPVPLVQVSSTFDEVWVAASIFEPVSYTSLFVAQAHRPGEHDSVNRFVFLDTRACMGQSIRIPNVGETFRILRYDLRIGVGSPNVVVKKPQSTMFFVRPPCQ